MITKFVGSHIHKDCLKAGIAFVPEEGIDESFAVQYVHKPIIPEGGYPGQVDDRGEPLDKVAYLAWLESLPTIWEVNPAFTHDLRIDASTTLPNLESEIQHIFTPDVLTSADTFLYRRDIYEAEFRATGNKAKWEAGRKEFSKFRELMQPRERLGNGLVLPKGYNAKGLITAANNKFKPLDNRLDSKGKILDIKPGTITIGAAAIDRVDAFVANYTLVNKENPADANGSITSIEIFAVSGNNLANCEVATFSASGNDLTSRDSEAIGAVTGGSKQTFSGKDMDAQTGDYIGCTYTAGKLECAMSGGLGIWWKAGDNIPCTSVSFSLEGDGVISLYGEGVALGYQDIPTRFRLTIQAFTDIATRLKLIVQAYKDITTRFRLGLFYYYKDIATRFTLISSLADFRGFVWDTVSRLDPGNTPPASTNYSDYWTEPGSFSLGTFFRVVGGLVSGQTYYFRACAHNEAGWSYGNEKSFATPAFKDIASRFRLVAQSYQDIATRFKLTVQNYKDATTRFRLVVTKDVATRFNLIAQAYKDTATRFELQVRNYVDVGARFRLWAQTYGDAATRFKLWVQAHQDTATRFVLHVLNYKDVATRFRLTVQAYLDITTLFRLIAGAYTDIVARFGLSIQTHRDTSTRFFLHQPTWEEFEIQEAVAALRARIVGLELEPKAHFRI
ncbi:hypothetical protein ES703_31600 [subsurface metagenome]